MRKSNCPFKTKGSFELGMRIFGLRAKARSLFPNPFEGSPSKLGATTFACHTLNTRTSSQLRSDGIVSEECLEMELDHSLK